MEKKLDDIKDVLKQYKQEQVLNFYDKLDEKKKKELLTQISEIDFELIEYLYKNINKKEIKEEEIKPISYTNKNELSKNDISKNKFANTQMVRLT